MVKKIWTNDRSELTMDRIQSLAMIKFNSDQTCTDFYSILKTQPDVLRAIKSNEKYPAKKNAMNFKLLPLAANERVDIDDVSTQDIDDAEDEGENDDEASDDGSEGSSDSNNS